MGGSTKSFSLLLLLVVCVICQPAGAGTSTYVFLTDQSTVVQTGGIAGVHETYSIEGQFRLTVDFDAGTALFDQVDANLVDESPFLPTKSLGELFNMAELLGTVVDDTIIDFVGKTADGMESTILLTLTFRDDSAHLTGRIVPPPNSADFFIYELDAGASKKYGGGTGEPNDPYLIYTAEQMNAIGAEPNDWDKHFKLMANIDLSAYMGTDFNIIGYWVDWSSPDNKPFAGVFDGNGHTISNFTCTSKGKNHIGLFGYVYGKNAHIKDLGLIDPNIDAGRDVGSLVGCLEQGTLTNCYAQGGSVAGNGNVGGLVGLQDCGAITNCYARVRVSGDTSAGGLVGYNNNSCRISNCYSSTSASGKEYVGGLVGNNRGAIINCYAMGSVSGIKIVGGIAGGNGWPHLPMWRPNPPGDITNCYSNVNVSGSNHVGGLVGRQGYGRVTASFWDIETSGMTNSDGGTGKTTVEMQTDSTFIGWGCEPTVWTIDEEVDYPRLAWENKAGSPLSVLSEFLAGTGTQTEPFLIYTVQELDMIGQFPCEWSKHFKLMADIDLSGFKGKEFNVIGDWRAFTGVFDGNAHTISNFSYTSTEVEHIGFFGYVGKWGEDAHIKDLGLIDPNVDAGAGTYVGSLIGRLHYGTITGCYAKGGSVSGNYGVGGLVGWLDWGTITNCYSRGNVSGNEWVGGLTGYNYRSSIINSYSTGSVSGNENIGGLVGDNLNGEITNSFWDIETSGLTNSAGGTGKTTAEMQTESTFTEAGWDFVGESENGTEDIWSICEGTNYPRLVWQIATGDFVCPEGITIEDFLFFIEHWRDDNCDSGNDYCQGTDLDFSGTVDEEDLEIFLGNWLADVRRD